MGYVLEEGSEVRIGSGCESCEESMRTSVVVIVVVFGVQELHTLAIMIFCAWKNHISKLRIVAGLACSLSCTLCVCGCIPQT